MTSLSKCVLGGLVLGVAAIGFHASPSVAQETPATQPATQPSQTVTVTVNGQDGKPAAGVTVSMMARRGRRGAGAPAATQPAGGRRGRGTPVATGTTDDKGIATLSNVPPGSYTVTATSTDGTRGTARVTVSTDQPATADVTLGVMAGRGGGGGGGGGNGGGGNGGGGGGN